MSRPVLSLRLYRENRHVEPSIVKDVFDIVGLGLLAFVGYLIAWLVMA